LNLAELMIVCPAQTRYAAAGATLSPVVVIVADQRDTKRSLFMGRFMGRLTI